MFDNNESSLSFVENNTQGSSFDCCRVCFRQNSSVRDPLINLCKCSGTVKYIHYNCLKTWISKKQKRVESPNYFYYEF